MAILIYYTLNICENTNFLLLKKIILQNNDGELRIYDA